ncbi:hypothetical protein MPTK1_3g25310 [Marchantia polymorpha subsp. ruderalis]|uniref:Uncharacterized protein n=2 Tax=Marchantia polymorpha TaxID=3197 RepID=A0AAF6B4M6_MARPO|nr:hypothetical protein MARPO_0100s0044 [Marchantia polymorpha]BBN06960.1 hypothetical protein Mp_3g25310 [Marchantia polymorpha subsp. ruderalis]|eukprot:PTQ32338.1 hypothetical protein MARPO_0100s0044 [Marchantia polymorpha]
MILLSKFHKLEGFFFCMRCAKARLGYILRKREVALMRIGFFNIEIGSQIWYAHYSGVIVSDIDTGNRAFDDTNVCPTALPAALLPTLSAKFVFRMMDRSVVVEGIF